MKYKVGDRVKVKSLQWYNENSDDKYNVVLAGGWYFSKPMSILCGNELTIRKISHATNPPYYIMEENTFIWTDEMIECKVEDENKPKFKDKESKKEVIAWMPNGKLIVEKFNDGTITTNIDKFKYTKVSINSEFCDDKVELVISPDFELKQEGNKWFAVKKKKEYPKTYEECCKILRYDPHRINDMGETVLGYKRELIRVIQMILICRDAYWKIAGEEMGLGKPWEPAIQDTIWGITRSKDEVENYSCHYGKTNPLEFPTEEMRDAFKENFKGLIEECKELL